MYTTRRPMVTAKDDISVDPARRFTVEEYYRLAEVGIIEEHDRVELIDGQILVMEPISSQHGGHTKGLNHVFSSRLRDRAIIGVQDPIQINEYNHPQPDITVCRPRDDFYRRSHPGPEDIFLIAEVAWTSAARDRRLKVPLYGRAGIMEYWLIDIPHRTLEVYTSPREDGYDRSVRMREGETLRLVAFPDIEITVEEVVFGEGGIEN